MWSTLPVNVINGLLLELVDLLVQGIIPDSPERSRYPRRAPALLAASSQEKIQKIQQVYAPIALRVEPTPRQRKP